MFPSDDSLITKPLPFSEGELSSGVGIVDGADLIACPSKLCGSISESVLAGCGFLVTFHLRQG